MTFYVIFLSVQIPLFVLMWWYMPVSPAFERLKQEHCHKFQSNTGYIMRWRLVYTSKWDFDSKKGRKQQQIMLKITKWLVLYNNLMWVEWKKKSHIWTEHTVVAFWGLHSAVGVCWRLQAVVRYWGKTRQETEGRDQSRDHGRRPFTGMFSLTACFLNRTTRPGVALATMGYVLPHQSLIKMVPHGVALQAYLMEAIF